MNDYPYSRRHVVLMWVLMLAGIQVTASAAEISADARVDRDVVTVRDVIRGLSSIAPKPVPNASTHIELALIQL